MCAAAASKVTAAHLARGAYLYVRQSTLRQVDWTSPGSMDTVVMG